jgi:hypothetical protein
VASSQVSSCAAPPALRRLEPPTTTTARAGAAATTDEKIAKLKAINNLLITDPSLTSVALGVNRDLERRLTSFLNLSTQCASRSNQSAAAAEEFRFQIGSPWNSRSPFDFDAGLSWMKTRPTATAAAAMLDAGAKPRAGLIAAPRKASHRLP